MRVRLTARALGEAKRMKTWWQRNRKDSEDLFEQELKGALQSVGTAPMLGSVYERQGDVEVRRLLMPKTRNHV